MHSVWLEIGGALCVVIWLYLLLGHGRFWQVERLFATDAPLKAIPGIVAVVIPARDEADVIGEAVRSLLHQSCADWIHIFLVDDGSSDGTTEVAEEAALGTMRPESLTVVHGEPLPPGWSGKLWAVQQGVEQALKLNPRFLLLTDADIRHSPQSVAILMAVAEHGGYDLASFMVKLHCVSFAEKLLIPAFVFFFFLLYPPPWIREARRNVAGAAGGCMLIRPAALEKAGGITSIRGEIIDDCALAAAIKHSGGTVWLGLTPDTFSLRTYSSFGEIERMIARTAFNQLRHSALLLAGAIVGLALTYLLPVALLFTRALLPTVLGLLAWLLMSMTYTPMVRFYGLRRRWALTLPLSAFFYMIATVHSALKYWTGRGGEWKGRAQDAANAR